MEEERSIRLAASKSYDQLMMKYAMSYNNAPDQPTALKPMATVSATESSQSIHGGMLEMLGNTIATWYQEYYPVNNSTVGYESIPYDK